jgi:predicted MFS family arabinose efflux permease
MMIDSAKRAVAEDDYVNALEYTIAVASVDEHRDVTTALAATVLSVIELLELAEGALGAKAKLLRALKNDDSVQMYASARDCFPVAVCSHILAKAKQFAGGEIENFGRRDEISERLVHTVSALAVLEPVDTERASEPVAEPAGRVPYDWAPIAAVLVTASAVSILPELLRTSIGVLGPELIRDINLSSDVFGLANASFFIALLLLQIPVGIAFDQFGARITVAASSIPMAVGLMLQGLAESGSEFVVARFITGVGCAAGFTASVVLVTRWFNPPFWSMILGWLIAVSHIGALLSSTPLASTTQLLGWRFTSVALGLVAIAAGFLFLLVVRDRPPGATAVRASGHYMDALAGVRTVLNTPDLMRLLAMFMTGYAALVTVQVLWTGPYLHDVHGLDNLQRGHVLLGMAAAQIVGTLLVGPLDYVLNTRKWVVIGTSSLTLGSLVVLATPYVSLPLAICMLLVISATSSYGCVLYAHIRGLIPDHLAGRGEAITKMAPLLGASLLPTLTGIVPAMFPSDAADYSPLAYQCIFATIATFLGLGMAAYLGARDIKPRPASAADALPILRSASGPRRPVEDPSMGQ